MSSRTTEPRLTWKGIVARRLDRHYLSAPSRDAQPADIVRAMCGAHAQILTAGEHSIALRIEGATRSTAREALWKERTLVKTYGPRGTVHLLPTEDLPMWTGALSAVALAWNRNDRDAPLTPDQSEEVIEGIATVLVDTQLTVDELTEALVDHVGAWAGDPVMDAFQDKWPRWRAATAAAANRGALCFGPNKGRKVTYTNPHRWLPGLKPADGQFALAALLKAYLRAYGPATPQQVARWLDAPPRLMRDLFNSLADELEEVEVEDARGWIVEEDTSIPERVPEGLRLLPYFDAFVVGCHPRERLFPGRAAERALAGGQAGNFPVMLIAGVVAGVWHQRRSGRKLYITVEPLDSLTATQRRKLGEQVERVGQILEGTPELTIGPVTVGAHA